VEKRDRDVRGRATEGLEKAKGDMQGAFALLTRFARAIDMITAPLEDEPAPEPEPQSRPAVVHKKIDARLVRRTPDGSIVVVPPPKR
jgi:hypothetical protein